MGEAQQVSRFQVRMDHVSVDLGLHFVGDKQEHCIRPARHLRNWTRIKSIFPRLLGVGIVEVPDEGGDAAIPQV